MCISWICLADPSNHHQRHARGSSSSKPSAGKDKDQSILDPNTYLELVESQTPPEDAVLVPHDSPDYYIILTGKCNKVKLDILYSQTANNEVRQFLVNKDNFENLEWKTWADIQSGQTPFTPVWICKRYYIAQDEFGMAYLTKTKIKKKNMQTEVLTLNNDIKWEVLQIDNYVVPEKKTPGKVEVLKKFTAVNKNCDPAKHVVKLDQGSDESSSLLKGRTHTIGGAIEGSVSGQTPTLINLGGKVSLKYDYSRSKTITTSNVDKVLHSVSMEVQVPPNQSCTIEITSTTFTTTVPYSGQLIRQYRNNEERTTSVSGIYENQEVAELQTSVNRCTPVKDAMKCGNA